MRIRHAARQSLIPALFVLLAASALLALGGCGSGTNASTATPAAPSAPLLEKDADGRAIVIPAAAPQRIISLTPSNSEILAALGVGARVIGVDDGTDYPADFAAKAKVTDGGAFKANVEQIVALRPDLVLNTGQFWGDADQQLAQAGIAVVDLPAPDLEGTLKEIRLVGQLVHAYPAADALATSMQRRIDAVKRKAADATKVGVYMEADYSTPGKPFTFGGGSFGDELITDAGGTNVFHGNTANGGYPQVGDESVIAANPQVIVLSEDPQFGSKPEQVYTRTGYATIDAVKNHRVYAISPDISQRPGPRIVDGLEQLAKDLHPELFA